MVLWDPQVINYTMDPPFLVCCRKESRVKLLKGFGIPAIPVLGRQHGRGKPMAQRNLPDPFEIEKDRFQN